MAVLPEALVGGRDFTKPLPDPAGLRPLPAGALRVRPQSCLPPRAGLVGERPADQQGHANFDSMRYEYFRDATVALEAFKAGQIDFRTENIAKDWATAYDFPAVQKGWVKREEIRHDLPTGMQGFAMNLRRAAVPGPARPRRRSRGVRLRMVERQPVLRPLRRAPTAISATRRTGRSPACPEGRSSSSSRQFRTSCRRDLHRAATTLPVTEARATTAQRCAQALEPARRGRLEGARPAGSRTPRASR